jgi:hypothetical protein
MASYNNSSEINDISYDIPSLETFTSRNIKFSILLILQLLSISCSLFLLFHLLTKSTLRRALHNHTIIALVIVNFFQMLSDLPMTLDYLRRGRASSSSFCMMWNFFAFSNYAVGVWGMTWASLERHILIFHKNFVTTLHGKILFHYIPLFISLIIPWIYYIFLVFLYPCTNTFYQSFLFCGFCCYAYNDQLVFFNWLLLGVIPPCCITLFSVCLIIRVVVQKRRVHQRIHWRQHRRMVIQLLSISCLYIFFDDPTVVIGLIKLNQPTFGNEVQMLYLYYIAYLLPALVPFVCLNGFRELLGKRREKVHPAIPLTYTRTIRRNEKTNTQLPVP